jgi:hypothetical protein
MSISAKTDRKLIEAHQKKTRKRSLANDFKLMEGRARSVTVGTAFGGAVELSMRKADGSTVYAILQPVETIELINQMAAGVGCHIHIQPRKDFASWRDWKYTEEELAHYRGVQYMPGVGHPPHANDVSKFKEVGANLPPPQQQPGLQPALRSENEQTMATQKTVGRKRTKRAAAAA